MEKTIEIVKEWLIKNRNYKSYDFTDEFVDSKIKPLLKMVEHEEIMFDENHIILNLREPIEVKNAKGEVVKKINKIEFKARFQSYELKNMTKGIDITKDPMNYVDAQISVLTDNVKGVIDKLYDLDINNARLVSALFFLG